MTIHLNDQPPSNSKRHQNKQPDQSNAEIKKRNPIATFFLQPIYDVADGFEQALIRKGKGPQHMIFMAIAMALTWWVYVPAHEFLHVAGCVLTGGEVTELQIAPHYFGAQWAKLFPFVISGGDYAGRLSGFDYHNSDWVYLSTVFLPFPISIFLGIPLLKLAARHGGPMFLGLAAILALAPIYNVTGDYLEIASIIITRVIATLGLDPNALYINAVRSDDVFKLASDLFTNPSELNLTTTPSIIIATLLMILSQLFAIILAFTTYWLGILFTRLIIPSRPKSVSKTNPRP